MAGTSIDVADVINLAGGLPGRHVKLAASDIILLIDLLTFITLLDAANPDARNEAGRICNMLEVAFKYDRSR